MDKIIIKDASFLCNIGISSKERNKKQKIFIDAELFLDTKKAAKTDNLTYTVNYSEVYDLIKKIVEKKEYKLIETIADNIAENILNKFNIKKIVVNVKKPKLKSSRNKDLKYVAIEITRSKNG